ncbi:MAG: hypothetical protein JNM93_08960 [Bacteriovoracaceae bacterium]|nr:hypothetical protein [Bacteriovoracaceae bacterium]
MLAQLLLIALSVNAQNLSECFEQGKILGDGQNPNNISAQCFELVKAKSKPETRYQSDKVIVYAHANIIFHESSIRKGKISGEYSLLENIHAVDVDEKNQTVVVLANSPAAIYTYPLKYDGNIAPYYKFQSADLIDASDVKVIPETEELAVTIKSKGKIKFYAREANVDGRKKQNALTLKRELSGLRTQLIHPKDVQYSFTKKHLYVLEADSILQFALDAQGNTEPQNIIHDERLVQAVSFSVQSHGKLKIILKNGSAFEL